MDFSRWCRVSVLSLCLGAPCRVSAQSDLPPVQELPDLPRFYFDALSFASDQPGTSRVDLYVEVPYEVLHFTKQDDLFRSSYEVTTDVYDSAETVVSEKWWTEKIESREYEKTVSPTASKLSHRSFLLAPGKYTVSVQIKDNETGKTSRRRQLLVVKEYFTPPFSISDCMLVNRVETDSGRKVLYPNISGNVGRLTEGFSIFFEAYSSLPADTARIWVTIRDLKGTAVQSDSFPQPLAPRRTSCFRKENTSALLAGDYTMEVKAVIPAAPRSGRPSEISSVSTRPLAIHWRGLPVSIVDLNQAIDEMQYVTDKDVIDEMKNAPPEKKRELFQQFWKKKDPTPGTERNELMDEYYSRVEYANKHFGHYVDGWKTDMGMVYIIFGPPSNIDRHPFDIDVKPYEVWTYYDQNRQFVFVDLTGFGDYRLQTPIWDVYGTRPR